MGQRKVTILDPATEEVARIGHYIEGLGMPGIAKKFIDETFDFFLSLSDDRVLHHPCKYLPWDILNYRCANFKKEIYNGISG